MENHKANADERAAQLKGRPLTSTLMTIELQEQGKWNFGPVEWRNILVEVNTTETEWCTT